MVRQVSTAPRDALVTRGRHGSQECHGCLDGQIGPCVVRRHLLQRVRRFSTCHDLDARHRSDAVLVECAQIEFIRQPAHLNLHASQGIAQFRRPSQCAHIIDLAHNCLQLLRTDKDAAILPPCIQGGERRGQSIRQNAQRAGILLITQIWVCSQPPGSDPRDRPTSDGAFCEDRFALQRNRNLDSWPTPARAMPHFATFAAAILRRRSLFCPFFPAPQELRSANRRTPPSGRRTIFSSFTGQIFCRTVAHQIAGKHPSSSLMSNA